LGFQDIIVIIAMRANLQGAPRGTTRADNVLVGDREQVALFDGQVAVAGHNQIDQLAVSRHKIPKQNIRRDGTRREKGGNGEERGRNRLDCGVQRIQTDKETQHRKVSHFLG
jgi:hypothetical protein